MSAGPPTGPGGPTHWSNRSTLNDQVSMKLLPLQIKHRFENMMDNISYERKSPSNTRRFHLNSAESEGEQSRLLFMNSCDALLFLEESRNLHILCDNNSRLLISAVLGTDV